MMMTPWVTRLLLANAAMYLVTLGVGGLNALSFLVLVPAYIPLRPWTVITYMFLHAGLGHIFFNMLALFFFGPRLEERLGGSRFLRLYLISGLGGALLSLITPFSAIVGASGAVFGVLYGFAHYWPRERIYIWGVLPVEARVLVTVVAVVSLYFGFRGGGGVAHFAHLGGFLGGYLYLKLSERLSPAARFKAKAQVPGARRGAGGRSDLDRWKRIQRDGLHPLNREELNRILDKISAKGVDSLTAAERAFLERFSARPTH